MIFSRARRGVQNGNSALRLNRSDLMPLDQLPKFIEQRSRIMRSGRGLGMILNAIDRLGLVAHSLDSLVVEIDAIDQNVAGKRGGVDGKAMILRSNFHPARFQVLDRLIGATMAELEFKRPAAESLAQNLVAETYPEEGTWQFVWARQPLSSGCG